MMSTLTTSAFSICPCFSKALRSKPQCTIFYLNFFLECLQLCVSDFIEKIKDQNDLEEEEKMENGVNRILKACRREDEEKTGSEIPRRLVKLLHTMITNIKAFEFVIIPNACIKVYHPRGSCFLTFFPYLSAYNKCRETCN